MKRFCFAIAFAAVMFAFAAVNAQEYINLKQIEEQSADDWADYQAQGEYLYQKGHRQIGFIGGGVGPVPMKRSRRFRSYLETMQDLGLKVNPQWVLDSDWDDKKCMELVENVVRGGSLPTAFYAASDLMAMAALRALYQMNVRVPQQVAVIGMSNIEMSQYANPPLTTIDVPTVEMGIAAARTIAARVRGDTTLPKRILLPSVLVERDSV